MIVGDVLIIMNLLQHNTTEIVKKCEFRLSSLEPLKTPTWEHSSETSLQASSLRCLIACQYCTSWCCNIRPQGCKFDLWGHVHWRQDELDDTRARISLWSAFRRASIAWHLRNACTIYKPELQTIYTMLLKRLSVLERESEILTPHIDPQAAELSIGKYAHQLYQTRFATLPVFA